MSSSIDSKKGGKPLESGGKYDITKEGPLKSRKCTDILFCLLFIFHIVAFCVVAGIGLKNGDPYRLVTGQDWQGNFCGVLGVSINSSLGNTSADSYTWLGYNMNVDYVMSFVIGTSFSNASSALNPVNLVNSGQMTSMITEFKSFVKPSCVTSCSVYSNITVSTPRYYMWDGPTDQSSRTQWLSFMSTATTLEKQAFNFTALSYSICPYDPKYCIPFSGPTVYPILDLYCIPLVPIINSFNNTISNNVADNFGNIISGGFGTIMGDLSKSWRSSVIISVCSAFIGLIFLILLRFFAGTLIWISLFLLFLILIAAAITILLYSTKCMGQSLADVAYSYNSASANFTSLLQGSASCVNGYAILDHDQRLALQVVSYVIFALAGLYLLIILFSCNRIRVGIAINKVAAIFLSSNMILLFLPIVQIIVAVAYWIIWIVIALYTISYVPTNIIPLNTPFTSMSIASSASNCGSSDNVYISYTDYSINPPNFIFQCKALRYYVGGLFGFEFFSLFWMNAFFIAIGQLAIAGAVGVWYFIANDQKRKLGFKPIRTGIYNCFRYHLGTLAFGTLILAMIMTIKWILYYVQANANKSKNRVLEMIAGCLACVVGCIEKIVKFLNKNAYIQTGLMGTNFCTSSRNSFSLVMRNAGRLAVLGGMSGIIHFIGELFICITTAAIGWFILVEMNEGLISSPIIMIILYVIIGYVIGKLVMNVFGISVDTILQCFVIDEEINRASGGVGPHTPELLIKFMENHKINAN